MSSRLLRVAAAVGGQQEEGAAREWCGWWRRCVRMRACECMW